MKTLTVEDIIRQNVQLSPKPNSKGFFSTLCKVCNDHGKKGPRAGFKFEGNTLIYNCFNCGHAAVYNPNESRELSKNMRDVLSAYNIPEIDWNAATFQTLTPEQAQQIQSIEPEEISFPPFFYPLSEDDPNEIAQYAIEYLTEERGIDWKSYPFYISHKCDHPESSIWYGRLIIPFYKDGKLIFWQGRDLSGSKVKKYLSCRYPKDNVLSNFTCLTSHFEEPLYILEGWFDAQFLDGVAVFGNKMTTNQIKWLNRTKRQKVVIPDRFGDGHLLARQALDLGWSISTPDIGSCKDISDAVKRYGLLYTQMTVKEHTSSGETGRMRLGVYCEPPRSKKTDKEASKKARS